MLKFMIKLEQLFISISVDSQFKQYCYINIWSLNKEKNKVELLKDNKKDEPKLVYDKESVDVNYSKSNISF